MGSHKKSPGNRGMMRSETTANHRHFVGEYLANGRNAKRAYMAVYPNAGERGAEVGGSNLLRNTEVQARVAERARREMFQ